MFSISATFANIKLRSFFIWMLLGAVIVLVPLYVLSPSGGIGDSIFTLFSDSLIFFAFPLLWISYKMKSHNLQFRSFLDRPIKWDWKLIILATGMGILFSFGISTIEFFLMSYVAPHYILDTLSSDQTIDNTSTFMTFFNIFSACVFAPIMEEIIFRGFFLNRLSYKWGIRKAVIVSSFIFGLGHSDVIGATIFGITMCLIYIKTRSLLVGMAVHSLNNLAVSVFQFASPSAINNGPIKLSDLRSLPDLLLAVIAVGISMLWLIPFIRNAWRRATEEGLPQLRFRNTELAQEEHKGVFRQVVIAADSMAVKLPDEYVNQLKLEEEDYVKLEMDGEKLIITKCDQNHPIVS